MFKVEGTGFTMILEFVQLKCQGHTSVLVLLCTLKKKRCTQLMFMVYCLRALQP